MSKCRVKCPYCGSDKVRYNGRHKTGVQRVMCCNEECKHRTFQLEYKNKACKPGEKEKIIEMADVFKLFSDSTRLKIICSILNNELCVCDLCELLNLTQSNVSHQLQLLRTAKLVKYRKEGKQAGRNTALICLK